MNDVWLSTADVAELTGSSLRAVQLALAPIAAGHRKTWHGAPIVLRKVRSIGGASGWQYEVLLSTLPTFLTERYQADPNAFQGPLKHGSEEQTKADWLFELLRAALTYPARSAERVELLNELASKKHLRPDGKWAKLSLRTLHRLCQRYDAGLGHAAFRRHKRSDAGTRRVIVSAAADKALAHLGEEWLQKTHALLIQYGRSMIKGGASPSDVIMMASARFADWTRAAGFDPGQAQLGKICRLPNHFYEAERVFGNVHTFKHDRKSFEDRRPRIRRSVEGLVPSAIVCGDVHPVDIFVRRDDGSIATARMIAWLDLATRRLSMDLVLLDKGGGIRNADVIQSFINMVKRFGLPGKLLLDHGSEYNWAEFIDDALKLAAGRSFTIDTGSALIRSRPYNAAGKPIEGVFGVIERILAVIPGAIGGDRMRKKSANVGREPEPFPGTFEELKGLITQAIEFYHNRPQRGALRGRSPYQVYSEFCDNQWSLTRVEDGALRAAFSTEETRIVRQGSISVAGRHWTCRELQGYQRERVTVLVPKWEDWSVLPVRNDKGELFAYAEPDRPYVWLDPAGPIEARERERVAIDAVRELDRAAPDMDVLAERAKWLAEQPAPPVPRIGATLKGSDENRAIVSRLIETPDRKYERERKEKQQRTDRAEARLTRLRAITGGKS